MATTFSKVGFSYGTKLNPKVLTCQWVVLQPQVPAERLRYLSSQGVTPLMYLSLAEETRKGMPWNTDRRNPDWGSYVVNPGHHLWVQDRLLQAQRALKTGYAGLFLDNLDYAEGGLAVSQSLLDLLSLLRQRLGNGPIWVNRGYSLMPTMVPWIDGLVMEGFSCTWTPQGYQRLGPSRLRQNLEWLRQLRSLPLAVSALDYATEPQMVQFAHAWAQLHGVPTFVADRSLH